MSIPGAFGIPASGGGGGGGGWTPPGGDPGDRLVFNASGVIVALPQGETALSISGGASTIDLSAGRTFTGTLTGAVAFSVSNTWGNRSFALRLTNSGTINEPTWPTGSKRAGEAEWVTTTGISQWVFFTWRAADSLVYSFGEEAP